MHIRPATRADSADIVILDDIASSGLASHVLQVGVREGKYDRPLEFGRDGYAFMDGLYSWKNVLIAETEDGIAGMSLSFDLTGGPGDKGLPDPVLDPLDALKEQARSPFIAFSDNHAATHWVLLTRPARNPRGAPASAQ